MLLNLLLLFRSVYDIMYEVNICRITVGCFKDAAYRVKNVRYDGRRGMAKFKARWLSGAVLVFI